MNHYVRIVGILFFALLLSTGLSAQRNKNVDDALNDKNPLSNFHVGSYVGLGYNNGWQLEFAPGVGYKVFDFLIVEGGINYAYSQQFFNRSTNERQVATLIGPRIGVKGNFYQQFYGLAEFQYQAFKAKLKNNDGTVVNSFSSSENIFYLGVGYSSSFGQGVGFYTDFVFDVIYDRINSPRPAPYGIRFGVFYTFP